MGANADAGILTDAINAGELNQKNVPYIYFGHLFSSFSKNITRFMKLPLFRVMIHFDGAQVADGIVEHLFLPFMMKSVGFGD